MFSYQLINPYLVAKLWRDASKVGMGISIICQVMHYTAIPGYWKKTKWWYTKVWRRRSEIITLAMYSWKRWTESKHQAPDPPEQVVAFPYPYQSIFLLGCNVSGRFQRTHYPSHMDWENEVKNVFSVAWCSHILLSRGRSGEIWYWGDSSP